MRTLLNRFADTGIDPAKIERFLRMEPKKAGGSILDQIAAEAANELLGALGQVPRQDAALVKQLRDRGLWRHYDERPSQ